MQNKIALLIPAGLLLVGLYVLGTSFVAGESMTLFGIHELPTRFGYILGALGVFGGGVVLVEMVVGGRAKRTQTNSSRPSPVS